MAFKCPVPGCEDSEKGFQTEAALKSYICNFHPVYNGGGVREVHIVRGCQRSISPLPNWFEVSIPT